MAIIIIIFSYLIGSIPSAYIAGKLWKGIDIRKFGDGNVGAANVFREVGPAAGLCVMAADIAKGAVVVMVAQAYASPLIAFLAGLVVVGGHNWSVFISFKGGRGEATATGVLLALFPQAMLILMSIALIPFIITRNTILLGAMLFAPLWLVTLLLGTPLIQVSYTIALPVMVGINHYFTTRNLSLEIKKRYGFMRQ